MRSDGIDAWAILTVLCAAAVAAPLLGLPLSFVFAPGALSEFSGFVPEAVAATAILLIGVGSGTLLLGTGLAVLVSFCDFPGRGWVEWALVLPLAMPGYVFTLFALGRDVPGIRSALGAVCIFTLVLYPYVYLLGRAAFLAQSRTLLEAARGLGLSRGAAIVRVGLPLARPAILGGVALALMEALADFGTVNLLGVRTFTDAIYRVWFIAFDRDAAMQLATLLVSVTLALLLVERLAKKRARYQQLAGRGEVAPPVRLRGPAAAGAGLAARTATIGYGLPGSVVAVAVIVPLGWIERRIDSLAGTGLLLTGTVIGLFYAYLVRFLALAWGAVEASLTRIPRQLDEAARGLGADRLDALARVHVPLMRTGLVTAALLVFVEVMKELPATLLLRPLGGDTLAIAVWQATTESLFRTAALPALLIVLVGLLPVAAMIRLSGRRGAELEAAQTAGAWAEELEERRMVPA